MTKLLLSTLLAAVLFTTGCVVGDIQAPKAPAKVSPSISSISPTGGPLAGGTTITIRGAGFLSGMTVDIDGIACPSVSLSSSTQATCTTPTHTAGAKTVTITNSDGETSSLASGFTYASAPAVTSISPSLGTTAGGTTLTITGSGFVSGASVAVGSVTCSSVSVISATSLTCVTGARTAGSVSAIVTNSDGQASSAGGVFAYTAPPNPTSVDVNAGALAGSTNITITGTDFTNPAGVTINGVICSSPTVTGTTQIACATGANPAGTYDIVVTNSTLLTGTLSSAFTYQAAPTVTAISPTGGNPAGGTTVTITGTGFDTTNGISANLGGANCGSISSLTTTSFTCVTSASTGTVNVNVINLDGDNQSNSLVGGFTYQNAPSITTVVADNGASAAGALAGGTNLTVNGADFISGAVVTVGGSTCTQVTFATTQIVCTTPAGSAGAANVVVTNPDGQTVTATGAFTYQAAPTITSISPNGGPTAGGQTVTITGTGFDATNGVSATINGSACTPIASLTATSFTCTSPTGALGARDVVVTNTDGDLQSVTSTGGYTYRIAPTVSGASPSAGALAGGTSVTISGAGFISGATVTVGGSACTSPVVNSSVSLTCTLPSGTAGAADIVVTNNDGQNSGTSGNGDYTYQVAPVLSSLSPTAGTTSGGFTITLTGTDFRSGAGVKVDGNTCGTVNVASSTTITCVAPSGTIGTKNVVVTNSDGQASTLATSFKYQSAPSISNISPVGGPPAGGGTLQVFGSGFDMSNGVSSVKIGTADCTGISVISTGLLTCTIPAQVAGAYGVTVINGDGGTQNSPSFSSYTYATPPDVLSVSPTGGALAGGNTITITGTDFANGATVLIGSSTCNNVTFVNTTTITCEVPSSGASTTSITVTNPDGQQDIEPNLYTYAEAPFIASVNANNGDLDGGTTMNIFGNFFVSGAVASIGGVDCASTTFSSISLLVCTTAANSAGVKDVVVTNPDGQTVTLSNGFTHQAAPTVTAVSPGIGSTAGGTSLTITGTGFDTTNGVASVTIAGTNCASFTVVSATQITCITGTGAAGNGNVVVTNNDADSQVGTLVSGFTYIAPPDISGAALSVTNGPASGGTSITITGGSGFLNGGTTSVTINGVSCSPIVFISSSSISCTTGAATAGGPFTLTVTNFDGQSDTGLAFTYDPAPTILTGGAGLSQVDSQLAGGDTLTITGTDFVATPTVTIGGTTCTSPTWLSTGTMTCVIPAGTAGAADIVLTNPDGQSVTLSNEFTYRGVPVVSSVSPSVVSTAGGTSLTINGSGFVSGGTLAIDVGGSACTSPTFVSSTQLTCTSPALTAGSKNVTVTNGDANAQVGSGTGLVNYIAPPTIGGIAPSNGPITGGTSITITGTNFVNTPTPTVTIDGNACTSISVPLTTQITCTTPAGTSGAKNVVVTTYGTLSATSAGGFTYDPPPTVSSVDIPSGPVSGGTVITITGTDFVSTPTSISVGGVACGTIGFTSSTTINCTTGSGGTAGTAQDIIVTNPDGQSGTGSSLFTYNNPPVLSSISPTEGIAGGGETITITGTNLIGPATVLVGGSVCSSPTVVNSTTMTCVSPPLTGTATYNVDVTNADGQSDTLNSSWTAEAVPTFSGITPNSGTISGGTSVTISGTNFEAGATVYFGATGVTPATITATSIIATAPSSASTGAVDIIVQNSNGQSVTISNAYTYNPAAPELDWQLGGSSPNPPNPDNYAPGAAANESHTYTLTNVGSVTSGTITVSLSGTNTGAFFLTAAGSGDNCTGNTLAPGATCTVQVVFLGAVMPGSATYNANLDATDGTTSDSNAMIGTLP